MTDEYHGLPTLEAAKLYIKKIVHSGVKSVAFLDIVAAILWT